MDTFAHHKLNDGGRARHSVRADPALGNSGAQGTDAPHLVQSDERRASRDGGTPYHWNKTIAKPAGIMGLLLGVFFVLQSRIPLRTAVQIGADEGFELAKATLCLKGYKLYRDVWCDHPPLHTWLITQAAKLQRSEPLTPALSPSDGERVSAGRVSGKGDRRDALSHYSPLGPRLVTVGFAGWLLVSVFVMAFSVGRAQGFGQPQSKALARGNRQSGAPHPGPLPIGCGEGVWTAGLAMVFLMASPGFLELSSSCMMEIPALAPAVAALCVLLTGQPADRDVSAPSARNKWHWREIVAGILFGIGLCMKLLGLVLLPVAALIIWLGCRDREVHEAKAFPSPGLKTTLSPSDGERDRERGRSAILQLLFPRGYMPSLLIVGMATVFTFVALDLLIDRGAFLRHFQQTWVSHFAPAVSSEYGSPSDHRFPPSLLLKNWDMTLPAVLGICVLMSRAFQKRKPLTPTLSPSDGEREWPKPLVMLVPVGWLVLMVAVFATHTPWWSYYYVHIAIPLSWCAAIGYVSVCSALLRRLKARSSGTRQRRQVGTTFLLRQVGITVALVLFGLCAAGWMGARVYLQIAGIRNSPQTYYALVLKEIERFKPFTEWIYADNLTYSFHSDIPMPPQLAVVSLKRLWSGDMTVAGVGNEVRKFKPGVIALRNDTRELPFQDLLDTEYRLVYHDAENRLYAHRSIANKANQ